MTPKTSSDSGMVAVMREYAAEYAGELAQERPAPSPPREGAPRMAWIGVARVAPTGRTAWGR